MLFPTLLIISFGSHFLDQTIFHVRRVGTFFCAKLEFSDDSISASVKICFVRSSVRTYVPRLLAPRCGRSGSYSGIDV